MMERVDSGLAVVEVGWWDPFGGTALIFAGCPTLFGECVVGAAGQGEVIDVGDGVGGVGIAVMDLAQIARHAAAGERTPTIFGVQDNSLSGRCQSLGVIEPDRLAFVENAQVIRKCTGNDVRGGPGESRRSWAVACRHRSAPYPRPPQVRARWW